MSSPFTTDSNQALQAHHGFAQAAMGVGVRRISTSNQPPKVVGTSAHGCYKPVPIVAPTQDDRTAQATELPSERTRLECPHCDTPSLIRSSRRITKLTREVTYCCNNPECGHTFVAHTEIVRTLSPSATPDPSIHLPLSTHVRRDLVRAQMDYAQQSPHCPVFSKLTGDLFGGNAPPAD